MITNLKKLFLNLFCTRNERDPSTHGHFVNIDLLLIPSSHMLVTATFFLFGHFYFEKQVNFISLPQSYSLLISEIIIICFFEEPETCVLLLNNMQREDLAMCPLIYKCACLN